MASKKRKKGDIVLIDFRSSALVDGPDKSKTHQRGILKVHTLADGQEWVQVKALKGKEAVWLLASRIVENQEALL